MSNFIFTDEQCREILAEYNSPDQPSYRDLADKYYTCPNTIKKAINKAGGTGRHGYRTKYNIEKIQFDWNNDVPSSVICRMHGVPNPNDLYSLLRTWRRKGWNFTIRFHRKGSN